MAKKQTRRTVSFNRVIIEQLRDLAARLDVPVAQVAEVAVREIMKLNDALIAVLVSSLPIRTTTKVASSKRNLLRAQRLAQGAGEENLAENCAQGNR